MEKVSILFHGMKKESLSFIGTSKIEWREGGWQNINKLRMNRIEQELGNRNKKRSNRNKYNKQEGFFLMFKIGVNTSWDRLGNVTTAVP